MAGFFGSLFGTRTKYIDESDDRNNGAQSSNKDDFFLSADDAKSLGDIDYMRTARKIAKTFPRTLRNPKGFEVTSEISSMERKSASSNGSFSTTPTPKFTSESSPERRRSDSNMDMFRNMARDIKKGK